MADLPSKTPIAAPAAPTLPSAWQCFLGALVSGALAFGFSHLTTTIAQAFAAKGLPTTGNITTVNIAVAVRTLVVGMSALGTFIFGLAAIGLLGLGLQVLFTQKSASE